jgi:PhnB protein
MENQITTQVVVPYLVIPNALQFYGFVQKVFGGTETARFLNDDQSLMHGEVNIGGSKIMFGNASEQWTPQPAGLYVSVQDADETFKKAIDNGATVVMEIQNKDYGRTGGVKDPFGNTWWIVAER